MFASKEFAWRDKVSPQTDGPVELNCIPQKGVPVIFSTPICIIKGRPL